MMQNALNLYEAPWFSPTPICQGVDLNSQKWTGKDLKTSLKWGVMPNMAGHKNGMWVENV